MSKLYNQLKNIVAANVVRCARTTTYKHLGSLHNPLSHGNWSKGAGMYGGKVGGELAKKIGDRLRRAEASPAAAGLRRAQAEARTNPRTGLTPSGQRSADALRKGQDGLRERQREGMSGYARRAEASPEGQAFAREQRALRERQREGMSGYARRAEASPEGQAFAREQRAIRDRQREVLSGNSSGPRKREVTLSGGPPKKEVTLSGGPRKREVTLSGGKPEIRDWRYRGEKMEIRDPRNRGEKMEIRDFRNRPSENSGKVSSAVRDISGARRDAIARQISTLSGIRQNSRQEYERRQKVPIVRTEDGLPAHYEWVRGKGGDRLLRVDRPKGPGDGRPTYQTMEYRAPLDSRGRPIARQDLPKPGHRPLPRPSDPIEIQPYNKNVLRRDAIQLLKTRK